MTTNDEIDEITDEICGVEYLMENGDISIPAGEYKIKILKQKLSLILDGE